MGLLRRGLVGEPVRILQEKLGVTADGIFGVNTETALIQYQRDNGLSPDGIAGPDTFTAIGLPELVLLHRPLRGELVRKLQEALGLDADGVFGAATEAAVKKFQQDSGLEADGFVGPQMLALLPGFAIAQETIEASLVTEATPEIDQAAVEEAKQTVEPPPEKPLNIFNAGEVGAHIGKSIWRTVKSLF